MRLYFYCENCGSAIVLRDSVWLGMKHHQCPICGDEDGSFNELVSKEPEDDDEEKG